MIFFLSFQKQLHIFQQENKNFEVVELKLGSIPIKSVEKNIWMSSLEFWIFW